MIPTYTQFGGVHPETAALTNVLAAAGLRAPHTGQPFTEAMLFGIGGGLGAGYILYEFQEHNIKVLVQGFHHMWQYPMKYYQSLCDRIGVSIDMPETGGRKQAEQTLLNALNQGKAAVAWIDRAYMPYLQLPETMEGHLGHFVAVCGQDGNDMLIDDRAAAPFRVPSEVFADARARIGSYKNRLLLVEALGEFDFVEAIDVGLNACVEHLSNPSDSFSLPALRKWGKMMTDRRNKKGWPTLFENRIGLYAILCSTYEGIRMMVGAGALRGLYADFLKEAAGVTGNDRLRDVADEYSALGQQWRVFADAALPDDVEPFAHTKSLLQERQGAIMQGGDAWQASRPLSDELRTMSRQYNLQFPLDDAAVEGLFATMQQHIVDLYAGEVAALNSLKRAVSD